MQKVRFILGLSLALGGCDVEAAALQAPREPTREAIAAPRRDLAVGEKEAISAAVMAKLSDAGPRDFKWFPLVVRPHEGVVDYCGLVSGDFIVGEYDIRNAAANYRDYYAQLTFDRRGALSKVDVVTIGRNKLDNIPTMVDSICIQDGYDLFPVHQAKTN